MSNNEVSKGVERKALGRGLSALLGSNKTQTAQPISSEIAQSVKPLQPAPELLKDFPKNELPIEFLEANSGQPRKHFNEAKIEELSLSIREQGIIQPLIVKRLAEKSYQIIAGERRYRAAKKAGLKHVPVVIRAEDDREKHDVISLIENLQREDLNPVELAEAYERFVRTHNYTQEQLAQKLGISRVKVANTLRLLKLPEQIRQHLVTGSLSEGHGRALLSLHNEEDIKTFASRSIEERLSVRDLEAAVRERLGVASKGAGSKPNSGDGDLKMGHNDVGNANSQEGSSQNKKSQDLLRIEEELRELFGAKVILSGRKTGGIIQLYYSGEDSLHRLLHQLRLSKQAD